ncbi:MAG: hypothetical protein PHQ27_09980 [Victivallales bacterium]|nr:hypothetical protein [Victivallales bacterium]
MWTKDKRAHIKIFIAALAVTLTVHALLLLLFRMPGPGAEQDSPRPNRISLLPRESRHFNRKALSEWLVYADPTLIAKPNERFGYEQLVAPRGLRRDFSAVDCIPADSRVDFARAIVLPQPWQPQNEERQQFPLPDFHYPTPAERLPPALPLAVGNDGHLLTGLFAGVSDLEDILKKAVINGPTVIRLSHRQGIDVMPRFKVIKSCGDKQLDHLAVRAIVQARNGSDHDSGDTVLHVYWRPDGRDKP